MHSTRHNPSREADNSSVGQQIPGTLRNPITAFTDKITNEELWRITHQKSIDNQIKRRKWNWIGHTLRKETGATEKTALDWNPQRYRWRGRLKRTWRWTTEDEKHKTIMERGQGDSLRPQCLEALHGCPMLHKE